MAKKKESLKSDTKKKAIKKPVNKNPDGKANIDMESFKKAKCRMFELQSVNRDGLISIIRGHEGW